MGALQRNEARRFITFIDEIYNHRVKFICSAAAPVDQLFSLPKEGSLDTLHRQDHELADSLGLKTSQLQPFTGEEELFMFSRAVSRIKEMQTQQYLEAMHDMQHAENANLD
jgi:protein AFG1